MALSSTRGCVQGCMFMCTGAAMQTQLLQCRETAGRFKSSGMLSRWTSNVLHIAAAGAGAGSICACVVVPCQEPESLQNPGGASAGCLLTCKEALLLVVHSCCSCAVKAAYCLSSHAVYCCCAASTAVCASAADAEAVPEASSCGGTTTAVALETQDHA